jgi:hypothetical protein
VLNTNALPKYPLAQLANIKIVWKCLQGTKGLAYWWKVLNAITLFNYALAYLVYIELGWHCLQGTNGLAYYWKMCKKLKMLEACKF